MGLVIPPYKADTGPGGSCSPTTTFLDRPMPKPFSIEDWYPNLEKTLDFHSAYETLEGVSDPRAHTLRAVVRHLQLRHEEALEHFGRAEKQFVPGSFESSAHQCDRYATLLSMRYTACLLTECRDHTDAARLRTDAVAARIAAFEGMETRNVVSHREKVQAFHALARGDTERALSGFGRLIEVNRMAPQHSLAAYIGAAAVSYAMADYRQARLHYENVELCMAFSDSRLVFVQVLAWLLGMTMVWGWDGEASRWEQTISALEAPEETRALLRRRAQTITDTYARRESFVFA